MVGEDYPEALTGSSGTGKQDNGKGVARAGARPLATRSTSMNNDNVSTATTTPRNPMTMNKHL